MKTIEDGIFAQAREQRHDEEFSSEGDDSRSVATVVPNELERVSGGGAKKPLRNTRILISPVMRSVDHELPNLLWQNLTMTTITGRSQDPTTQ